MKAQGQVEQHGGEQDGIFAWGFQNVWSSLPAQYSSLILVVSVLVAGIWIKPAPASL